MKLNDFIKLHKDEKYFDILENLLNIGSEAKNIVLNFYKNGFDVSIKQDDSPVTQADLASNKFITTKLKTLYKDFAILSEEDIDSKTRLTNDNLFIVDPIDGTSDFINHDDEFAINLAYAYKRKVEVGVIVVPAINKLYFSYCDNFSYEYDQTNDEVTQIKVSNRTTNLIMLRSRMHAVKSKLVDYLEKDILKTTPCGSSYKGCLVSKGEADFYFTTSPNTKEWDVAPIDIIVRNAGGLFLDGETLKPFVYNRENPYNLKGFFCLNSTDLLNKIRQFKELNK